MSVRRRESSPERLGWGWVPAYASLPSGCRSPACDAREHGKVWWAPAPILISRETLESFQTVCTAFCLSEESCSFGCCPFLSCLGSWCIGGTGRGWAFQQDWGGACSVGHLVLSHPFSSSRLGPCSVLGRLPPLHLGSTVLGLLIPASSIPAPPIRFVAF